MILHVLPGDSLVETFKASNIEGETAVCRECLVEGDVGGETLPEFWETRAKFLAEQYGETPDDYHERVVREFAKLTALQSDSEINLWFEYELFCQTNLWFCLSLLAESTADVYRVAPVINSEESIWDGFGNMNAEDLRTCFEQRIKLAPADLILGSDLWSAYRNGDNERLKELSQRASQAFPKLREVVDAAIQKESRPFEIVNEILAEGKSDFDDVFREFKSRAGVYGYGDTQVKNLLAKSDPQA